MILKRIVKDSIVIELLSRTTPTSLWGCGYSSVVRVIYAGKTVEKEWQWRDPYNEKDDAPWLAVQDIDEVTVIVTSDKTVIKVVLTNGEYGNRTESYEF